MAPVVAGLVPVGLTHHGFSPEQVWPLPRLPINHSKQHREWLVASRVQDTLQLMPVQVQGVFHTKCHSSTPLSLQQLHSFLLIETKITCAPLLSLQCRYGDKRWSQRLMITSTPSGLFLIKLISPYTRILCAPEWFERALLCSCDF